MKTIVGPLTIIAIIALLIVFNKDDKSNSIQYVESSKADNESIEITKNENKVRYLKDEKSSTQASPGAQFESKAVLDSKNEDKSLDELDGYKNANELIEKVEVDINPDDISQQDFIEILRRKDFDKELVADYVMESNSKAFFTLGSIVDELVNDGKSRRARTIVNFLFDRLNEAETIEEFTEVLAGLVNTRNVDFYKELHDNILAERNPQRRARYFGVLVGRDIPSEWNTTFQRIAKEDSSPVIRHIGNNWEKEISIFFESQP